MKLSVSRRYGFNFLIYIFAINLETITFFIMTFQMMYYNQHFWMPSSSVDNEEIF